MAGKRPARLDKRSFNKFMAYRKNQNDAVAAYSDMLNILEGTNPGSKFEMLLIEKKLF